MILINRFWIVSRLKIYLHKILIIYGERESVSAFQDVISLFLFILFLQTYNNYYLDENTNKEECLKNVESKR